MFFYNLVNNNIVRIFMTFASFTCIGFTMWILYYMYMRLIRKDTIRINKAILIIIMIISMIGYYDIIHFNFFKDTNLNSRYQKEEYEKHYYAYIYEDTFSSKCYKLPVKIYTYKDEYETHRGNISRKRIYQLMYAYWNNDSYLTFNYEEIKPFEKCEVIDSNGKTWYIELINEPCNKYDDDYMPYEERIKNIKSNDSLSEEEKENLIELFQNIEYYKKSPINK